jgi:murein DD-endopeptidase MepM/ murein hydrolase activator NlpD
MQKKSSLFWISLIGAIAVVAGGLFWFFSTAGEWQKPEIRLSKDLRSLGQQGVLTLELRDNRGLSATSVRIAQGSLTLPVASVRFDDKPLRRRTVNVPIDPLALKLREGPAVLTISASDRSLWNNTTVVTYPVTIELSPPQIFPNNPVNIFFPGGAGVVTYRLSKPVAQTGVQVDEAFFPAHPVLIAGQAAYVCYFAIPMDARERLVDIRITARDAAGNTAASAIPHTMKSRKFRSDKMTVSDAFLQQKMPEFQSSIPALRGKTAIEVFRYVNGTLRLENEQTIRNLCRKTQPRALWEGTFLRMKNASPMALFGDRRTWEYQGQVVGQSLHLGEDLASLNNSAIEAANNGVVVFTGPLGIYGNAVLIDHGLELFSLYGHLSAIDARVGQAVQRGDVIGRSGTTGLAGGDHLHFSILVGGQFVDPREWWDPHWIEDDVMKKLQAGSL